MLEFFSIPDNTKKINEHPFYDFIFLARAIPNDDSA